VTDITKCRFLDQGYCVANRVIAWYRRLEVRLSGFIVAGNLP
jgi:hypothetical protein